MWGTEERKKAVFPNQIRQPPDALSLQGAGGFVEIPTTRMRIVQIISCLSKYLKILLRTFWRTCYHSVLLGRLSVGPWGRISVPETGLYTEQMNPFHTHTLYCFEINFDSILPSMPRYFILSIPFSIFDEHFVFIYNFSHACYMPLPSHPPLFVYLNMW
jgi:hypothetical protein